MRIHPAANLFPMLGDDDLKALAADIKANGQREPIILFEEKILDGRNRWAACKLAKVEPKMRVLAKCDSPTTFVLSLNLVRRHLTPLQRAAVAAEASPMFAKEAKDRQRAAGGDKRSASAKERIGQVQSVPKRSAPDLSKGKSVHKAAAATKAGIQATRVLVAFMADAPDVFAAVKDGTVEKLTDARRLAEMTPAKRTKVIEQMAEPDAKPGLVREVGFAEARAAVAAETRRAPEQAVIHRADYIHFLDAIPDESADLLLTDPPYMTDVGERWESIEHFVREWVPRALLKVKPTGHAYICAGAYPRELQAYLQTLLNPSCRYEQATTDWVLANVLVWTYRNTLGPTTKYDYRQNWQAVFYLHGREAPPLNSPELTELFAVQDINAPDGRVGDRLHAWQKPSELGERFIRHSTKAGDLVIDPFAGTGTFLIAAAKLGRRAIGCDSDPEMIKLAIERGCVEE